MSLQYVQTDSGRLAVEVYGQGPLVICSPGMGDMRGSYTAVAKQLSSNGYTVATTDPRGHGDSSTTFSRYGDEATADDFVTIAQHLGHQKVVLMGASFSAAAATIAAARQPDLVVGVVLLGPFLRNGMGTAGLYLVRAMFARPWGSTMWKSYAATLWPGLGPVEAKKRAAASTAMLTRPGYWSAFQNTVKGLDHRVVEPYIGKVQARVMVVMGEKDPDWSEPLKEMEWVAGQFQGAKTLAVPEAGHAPQFEKPDIVGNGVLEFVNELRSQSLF